MWEIVSSKPDQDLAKQSMKEQLPFICLTNTRLLANESYRLPQNMRLSVSCVVSRYHEGTEKVKIFATSSNSGGVSM